jgi:selenoprotein W-related protein
MPQAASLAARLKENFDVDAKLIEGAGGIFDVTVDGDLIFSKHDKERFPTDDEIVGLIKDRAS